MSRSYPTMMFPVVLRTRIEEIRCDGCGAIAPWPQEALVKVTASGEITLDKMPEQNTAGWVRTESHTAPGFNDADYCRECDLKMLAAVKQAKP